MAIFKAAYPVVREFEGGYVNDPADRGGETYKGVARKMHPKWEGWKIIDIYKKRAGFPANLEKDATLQQAVTNFFKAQFWDKMRLDDVKHHGIALELFDTAVNMGVGTAVNFLQRVLNVTNKNGTDYPDMPVDGVVGSNTIKRLNEHKRPEEVLKALNCLQGARYIGICEANPSQERFFSGWMKRVQL